MVCFWPRGWTVRMGSGGCDAMSQYRNILACSLLYKVEDCFVILGSLKNLIGMICHEQDLSHHFLLFYAWCVQSVHIFYYAKAILVRRKLRNNSQTTTAFVLHTGELNN